MNSMSGSRGPMSGTKLTGGYKQGQMQQFTPEQMDLYKQMFSHLGPDSYTARLAGGDQSLFDEMEAPGLRQFNELQGGIASRFSGMGAGARKSSGFQNTTTAAAQDFAGQLQANRQQMQQQAIKDLMGMSNDLLNQRPYENYRVEPREKKSGWQQFAAGALPLAGAAAGGYAGGTQGAKWGYKAGQAAGSAF